MFVARVWHGEVLRQVAAMNRADERRAAQGYLERQLRHFERYARGLPDGERLLAELLAVRRRIAEAWSERVRKEMALHAFKASRGEEDLRQAPRSWSAAFEPGGDGSGRRR